MSAAATGNALRAKAHAYPVPFWFRWALAPRSTWLPATGVGLAYLALAIAFHDLSGGWQGLHLQGRLFLLHPIGSLELAYALYFAWVPIAIRYWVFGAARDLEKAAPLLGLSGTAFEEARDRLLAVPSSALWAGVAAGLVLAELALAAMVASDSPPGVAILAWLVPREHVIDALIFSVVAWAVVVAVRFSRLAGERAAVRLLDSRVGAPFVEQGARLALLWLVMWSIQVPWLFFVPLRSLVGHRTLTLLVCLYGVGVVLTAIAIALPTRGVRDRIRAAKREELERVQQAIEVARAGALDAMPPSAEAAARLPGLLAWERRVQEVDEWPLDAPVLRRLGMYLLIPLGSWIGGALVEHVVDLALD